MISKETSWLDKYDKGLPRASSGIEIDPKYEYNPKTNPSLKGDSRKMIEQRLANARKSNTQRAIDANTAMLKSMDDFELSRNHYVEGQRAIVKEYTDRQTDYSRLQGVAKDKYGFDTSQEAYENSSPNAKIGRRAAEIAKASMKTGKGFPLYGDANNDLTCINGVCEASSQAGVDYSGMSGLLGVKKNEKGKDIPRYNVSWTEKDNFKKAGYRRLGKDEKPQEGDFAQYGFDDDKNPNTVDHMEMVTGASDKGVTTFNNYEQTKLKKPDAGVENRNYKKDSNQLENIADTGYFRLEEKNAKDIVEKNPLYTESANKYKRFKESEEYTKYKESQDYLNTNKAKYEEANKYLSENIIKARDGSRLKQSSTPAPARNNFKTQGEYNAALKTFKLQEHKNQLNNNPERLPQESLESYNNRNKYFDYKINKDNRKGYLNDAYMTMKTDQNKDPNIVTRAIRKTVTSPLHVAHGLSELVDIKDVNKLKSTKAKINSYVDLGTASMDALSLINPLDYGLKSAPLIKQVAKRVLNSTISEGIEDKIKEGIDMFKYGGEIKNYTKNNKKLTNFTNKSATWLDKY